jgi:hypothetical protein
VSVDSGSAFVSAQGRTVTVDAGFASLVQPGMPPTPPVPSPPPPFITTQMLTLLERGGNEDVGTRVNSRASGVEIPQMGGNMMLSPNIDPKIQSEIANDATPPEGTGGAAGSKGSHGSRGTH